MIFSKKNHGEAFYLYRCFAAEGGKTPTGYNFLTREPIGEYPIVGWSAVGKRSDHGVG